MVWYWAQEGQKEDYGFYEQNMLRSFEGRRSAFLPSMELYLDYVKDENTYRKGITFLAQLADRDPSETSAFNIAATIYDMAKEAEQQSKIANDKMQIEDYKTRNSIAMNAWIAYKKTVPATDKRIWQLIDELEKGKEE